MKKGKPNVLFIMDDQHRFDYLRCAGAGFLHTPNIDRLAARGVRFTHCISNAPVCAPARIGLASGLQPARLGALDNQGYLPQSVPTFYQLFRDHDYRVGCVGKLDLLKQDRYNGRHGDRPCVYGWGFTHPEECEGKMHAGSSPTPIGPYTYYLEERGMLQRFYEDYRSRSRQGWSSAASSYDSVLPQEAFEDCYIGRRSAAWLEKVPADFPWFLFVSFVGPHNPFDPPETYGQRYRNADVPAAVGSLAGKPGYLRQRQVDATPEEVAVTRRQYCAAIAAIDDQIGLLLDTLEKRGMAENTVVVFTSDHGEMLGDHGLYTKSVPYEPSLRVPLIMAGPGIAGGQVSETLVELIDLNPTVCELAGLPAQQNIDGRSLAPYLRGERTWHRTSVVSALRHFRCVRTEHYKLIENYNDVTELYDLREDPCELRNIARERRDIVRELTGELRTRTAQPVW
jgi:arylsulfatase